MPLTVFGPFGTDEAEALRLGFVVLDQAFSRARERLGDESVPCRRGCSACCEQAAVFEIHVADAVLLARGLGELPCSQRDGVLARARVIDALAEQAAAALAKEGEPSLRAWRSKDGLSGLPARVVERLADRVRVACPLLGPDGDCLSHAWRPAVCRLQGLPWRDSATGAELPDFCRVEPRQALNEPQPAALLALDELREGVRARAEAAGECGGRLPPGRTFVAEALLRAGAGRPGG